MLCVTLKVESPYVFVSRPLVEFWSLQFAPEQSSLLSLIFIHPFSNETAVNLGVACILNT